MERYSPKSKIKRIKVFKDNEQKTLFAEVIKKPSRNIPNEACSRAINEIRELVTRSWGDFGEEYLINHILNSYLLLVLRNSTGMVVGVASISKKNIFKKEIYCFELTVVDPDYQSLRLSEKMNLHLIIRLFFESLLKGQFKLEFMFITSNIRTLGILSRVSDFIYPNPYLYNTKTRKIPKVDSETWNGIKEFLKISKENYQVLEREGCVMEGFYNERPHLIYKEIPRHSDEKLNEFANKYLKPGKEVVVRAIVSLKSLTRYGFGYFRY